MTKESLWKKSSPGAPFLAFFARRGDFLGEHRTHRRSKCLSALEAPIVEHESQKPHFSQNAREMGHPHLIQFRRKPRPLRRGHPPYRETRMREESTSDAPFLAFFARRGDFLEEHRTHRRSKCLSALEAPIAAHKSQKPHFSQKAR